MQHQRKVCLIKLNSNVQFTRKLYASTFEETLTNAYQRAKPRQQKRCYSGPKGNFEKEL